MANNDSNSKKKFVYRDCNNNLILPDFMFSLFSQLQMQAKNSAYDFAIAVVNGIAGRESLYQESEINSDTYNFYTGLYNLIQKEGGINNCKMESDYISDFSQLDTLIQSGSIQKCPMLFDDNGELQEETTSSENQNNIKIKLYNIIRNVQGYLVIPDSLYEKYSNFDGDSPAEFAKSVTNNDIKVEKNTLDYYSAIYQIIEKEKHCIKMSDICNQSNIASSDDLLLSMIKSGKLNMSLIEFKPNGKFSENKTTNNIIIENSIYSKNKTQSNESEIFDKLSEIETKLQNLVENFSNHSEDEIQIYKDKCKELELKLNSLYYGMIKTNSSSSKKIESKYNELLSGLKKYKIQLHNLQKNDSGSKNDKIDYYVHIKNQIAEIELELNKITENLVVNSEEDYLAFLSKLSNLRNQMYDIFDSSMDAAYNDGSLLFSTIKEASTLHNMVMAKINKTIEELDDLKNKLICKHLFNT